MSILRDMKLTNHALEFPFEVHVSLSYKRGLIHVTVKRKRIHKRTFEKLNKHSLTLETK